jgi:hypothetical protein
MLDNIEVSISQLEPISSAEQLQKGHEEYDELNDVIKFYMGKWPPEKLPVDLKRLAENTSALMSSLRIDLERIKLLLDAETSLGRGVNTLSMSPFQIIVQAILNQEVKTISSFLKSKSGNSYKLFLTNGMTIPDIINRQHKKIIFIDGNEFIENSLATEE